MQEPSSTELRRDCPAVQIPSGESVTLGKGLSVDITQTLGGTYTVRTPRGLFRIASTDADALGLAAPSAAGTALDATAEVTPEQITEILRTCYDPEIPVNIVDLGLVYDVAMDRLPSGKAHVRVKMTLTAPGCGMGATIAGDAQQKILYLDGVEEATVEIVWEPLWNRDMITAEGRRVLGLE